MSQGSAERKLRQWMLSERRITQLSVLAALSLNTLCHASSCLDAISMQQPSPKHLLQSCSFQNQPRAFQGHVLRGKGLGTCSQGAVVKRSGVVIPRPKAREPESPRARPGFQNWDRDCWARCKARCCEESRQPGSQGSVKSHVVTFQHASTQVCLSNAAIWPELETRCFGVKDQARGGVLEVPDFVVLSQTEPKNLQACFCR